MSLSRTGRLGAALILFAAACATARYVSKTPTGGTLLLEGDPDNAKSQAERLMVIHCHGSYTVLPERERLTGTEAERLRQTKMSYVCNAPPPKPQPPKPRPPKPAVASPDADAAPESDAAP